jgi:hypothetical protein
VAENTGNDEIAIFLPTDTTEVAIPEKGVPFKQTEKVEGGYVELDHCQCVSLIYIRRSLKSQA